MVRRVLAWRIRGEDLVGTHHEPCAPRAAAVEQADASVGVLLLNAGTAPRSGNSDLSVHIADRLAARGLPVFRFDLPGLGDSTGPIPSDVETYWCEVLAGRNDDATLALIGRIKLQFGLSTLIVGGLCAAVVPALRAVDRGAAEGLILLEPDFHGAPSSTVPGREPAVSRWRTTAAIWRGRARARFPGAALWTARIVRSVRALVPQALRRSRADLLPKDANLPLVQRWGRSLTRGVRSLVIVAEGQSSDHYVERILGSMRGSEAVALVRVPQTNHVLTSGAARETVLESIDGWVTAILGSSAPLPR